MSNHMFENYAREREPDLHAAAAAFNEWQQQQAAASLDTLTVADQEKLLAELQARAAARAEAQGEAAMPAGVAGGERATGGQP